MAAFRCTQCNRSAPIDHVHYDRDRALDWRLGACPACGRIYAQATPAAITLDNLEKAA